MKKVIAILAIMIVLVGVVFAESENHTIKLRTSIGTDEPVFNLAAAFEDTDTSVVSSVATNTKTAFADGSTYNKTLDIADLSKESATVTFTAKLANKAKSEKQYTITFTPGPFNMKKYNGDNKEDYTLYANASSTGALISNFTDNRVGVSATDVAKTTEGQQISFSTTLTFNAKACVAGDLAIFTITYDQVDSEIDLVKGDYTADATMVVSTN